MVAENRQKFKKNDRKLNKRTFEIMQIQHVYANLIIIFSQKAELQNV